MEIKAIFEEDAPPAPTEYTVTVTNDGSGTASASPAKAAAGTEITLTATPNTGYHFKEWQVISGDVTIKGDKFTMPEGNVEIKAIFEEDAPPAPTEYTVTFDGNGGKPSAGSMTTTGGKLSSLPGASRSGYRFEGWYTEKRGGTKVTTATLFSGDTTVYARWHAVKNTGSTGTGSSDKTDTKPLESPRTGDSSLLGVWGISLCASLTGCLTLAAWQRRWRREEAPERSEK